MSRRGECVWGLCIWEGGLPRGGFPVGGGGFLIVLVGAMDLYSALFSPVLFFLVFLSVCFTSFFVCLCVFWIPAGLVFFLRP